MKRRKLSALFTHYQEMARQAEQGNQTYEGYLLVLSELESQQRDENAFKRRLSQAKFALSKTLDQFDFSAIPALNQAKVLNLAQGDYIGKHGVAIGGLFGVEFLMVYYGIDLTNASRAIIFLYTQPLWTALGAHFFLSAERLSMSKSVGLILSFAGLVTVFGTRPATLGHLYRVGDLIEVAASMLWAATNIYIKRFMLNKPVTHYQTLFSQLLFSVPVLAAGWLVLYRFSKVMPECISTSFRRKPESRRDWVPAFAGTTSTAIREDL